jgi:hypothetical protein
MNIMEKIRRALIKRIDADADLELERKEKRKLWRKEYYQRPIPKEKHRIRMRELMRKRRLKEDD